MKSLISSVADRYGIDPRGFLQMAKIESRFDPNAFHPGSNAAGLFQFIPSTAKRYGLLNPFDPEGNADAAGRLWNDNAKTLTKYLRRAPTAGEIYLAHQQGAANAANLLANPGKLAVAIIGKKAVVQNGGKITMTAAEFTALWIDRFK
jgi:soluble lytic murein transglycosylase-like protein